MRRCRMLGVALVLLLATHAVAGVGVTFDAEIDFSDYSTFEWVESSPPKIPELRDYLVRAMRDELNSAGLRQVESGGDLKISIFVIAETEIIATGAYHNLVTWDVFVISSDVRGYTEGTLIVDMVDAKRNRAVWQGTATAAMVDRDRGKARRKIDKITRKLFRNFPPEGESR